MLDAGSPQSRLVIDVQVGERLVFSGAHIEVQVLHKTGRAARLCIRVPREVEVTRVAQDVEAVAGVAPRVAV